MTWIQTVTVKLFKWIRKSLLCGRTPWLTWIHQWCFCGEQSTWHTRTAPLSPLPSAYTCWAWLPLPSLPMPSAVPPVVGLWNASLVSFSIDRDGRRVSSDWFAHSLMIAEWFVHSPLTLVTERENGSFTSSRQIDIFVQMQLNRHNGNMWRGLSFAVSLVLKRFVVNGEEESWLTCQLKLNKIKTPQSPSVLYLLKCKLK